MLGFRVASVEHKIDYSIVINLVGGYLLKTASWYITTY